jgi:hypothetical protein
MIDEERRSPSSERIDLASMPASAKFASRRALP